MEYAHVVGEDHKSVGGISQSVKIHLFFVTTVIFLSKKQNYKYAELEENIYHTSASDITGYYWDEQGSAGTTEEANQRLAIAEIHCSGLRSQCYGVS